LTIKNYHFVCKTIGLTADQIEEITLRKLKVDGQWRSRKVKGGIGDESNAENIFDSFFDYPE